MKCLGGSGRRRQAQQQSRVLPRGLYLHLSAQHQQTTAALALLAALTRAPASQVLPRLLLLRLLLAVWAQNLQQQQQLLLRLVALVHRQQLGSAALAAWAQEVLLPGCLLACR